MDTLFDPSSVLSTPIAHYMLAALTVICLIGWLLAGHNTQFRKIMALGFGACLSIAAMVLMGHLFTPGPIPPGAMP
jgi:hypothetical protein